MAKNPAPADVLAYMTERRCGYKAVAKHFGVTVDEARELVAAARAGSPARAPARAREDEEPSPAGGTREEYLVRALEQLEQQVLDAQAADSWTASVAAKREALKVRAQLDELRETQRRQAAPRTVADHRAEVLSEIRRLRIGATEAGSYVAAARLLQLERDMLAQHAIARSQEEEEELARASMAELEAEIERLRAARVTH